MRNQHLDTIEYRAHSQILTDINQKHTYTPKEIKNDNHGEISLINSDIKSNQKIMNHLQQKKWRQAYRGQIKYNTKLLNIPADGTKINRTYREFLLSQNFLCQALIKLNIADQSESSPTTGITFFLYIDDLVSSILIVLLTIFVCSQLYTKRFTGNIDKDTLLPIGIGKSIISNLTTGYGLAVSLSLLAMGLSFLAATGISGIGNLHYPFPYYTPQFPFNIYMPQSNFILPTIILRLLSACFGGHLCLLLCHLDQAHLDHPSSESSNANWS